MSEVISEVSYDYSARFLELAAKFFTVSNLSTLKVGMFGYHNEIHSYLMKNSVFHRNMLYNEYFLNTASLHSSVYNWAKILEEPVYLAQPSKMQIAFSFNLNELTLDNGGNAVIPRTLQFTIGSYKFLLPHDIILTVKNNSLVAKYDFSKANTNYLDSEIKTPFIKTKLESSVNGTVVILLLNIYQLESNIVTYKVIANDILERSIYDMTFKNNLAAFNIRYKEPNTSTKIPLNILFNDIEDNKVSKNIYYSPLNTDSIRFYFSSKAGFFKPEFNSELEIEILSCLGSESNFNFSGNISVETSKLSALGLSKVAVISLTDSVGGTDTATLQELKVRLIKKLRTRNSITTSYDLQSLFDSLKINSGSNSSLTTIKTKDDFIARQFTMYSVIKDSSNLVIPSTTIDLTLSISEIETLGYVLKAGTFVLYDRVLNTHRLLNPSEIADFYLNNSSSYLYSIPFLINFDFKEFPKINYFSNNYEKSYELFYEDVSTDAEYEVVINEFTIKRNSLIDLDSFKLTTYFNTSIPSNLRRIKLLVFRNGIYEAYSELNSIANTSEFTLDLITEDTFDNDGNFLILNTFRNALTGNIIPNFPIDDTIEFKLEAGIDSGGDFVRYATLSTRRNIEIAESLNSIIKSPLLINENTGMVTIKRVPLVSSLYFLNNKLNLDFTTSFESLKNILLSTLNLLENNTSLDLKLFNTYGPSNNFSSDTVDLSLALQIKLNTKADNIIDYNIKQFIVNFIEKINEDLIKEFALSNLLRALENNFPEISFIRFININGANLQNIEEINPITNNNYPKNYVPEYLTVKKIQGTNYRNSDFIYDINIVYL
jgi:hypothetical protein